MIPPRLARYLEERGARYEVYAHEHSRSSAETARSARLKPGQLAKAVVLEDDAGCVLAVVPSDRQVMLGHVARMLGRERLHLADEDRIATLFEGCERGAVPPIGAAWGLETVIDEGIEDQEAVFLEAGDHERLLRLSRAQFKTLAGPALRGRISQAMPVH